MPSPGLQLYPLYRWCLLANRGWRWKAHSCPETSGDPYKATRGTLDTIIDSLEVGSLEQPEVRKKAFSWLAERVNTFVNVLRPRMRSAAADYESRGE